jgi:hypothetical protein
MVCVLVPPLLKRNVGVLFGVLRGPDSDAHPPWACDGVVSLRCQIVSFFRVLRPTEDGQLTETCKGNKYLQIESHWTVLTIIL